MDYTMEDEIMCVIVSHLNQLRAKEQEKSWGLMARMECSEWWERENKGQRGKSTKLEWFITSSNSYCHFPTGAPTWGRLHNASSDHWTGKPRWELLSALRKKHINAIERDGGWSGSQHMWHKRKGSWQNNIKLNSTQIQSLWYGSLCKWQECGPPRGLCLVDEEMQHWCINISRSSSRVQPEAVHASGRARVPFLRLQVAAAARRGVWLPVLGNLKGFIKRSAGEGKSLADGSSL